MLVISAAKKIGLSFDELNELTAQDLIDLLHQTMGDGEAPPLERDATQEDIDRFFAS